MPNNNFFFWHELHTNIIKDYPKNLYKKKQIILASRTTYKNKKREKYFGDDNIFFSTPESYRNAC